ncbi:MAG: VOC family protein [Candidatus Dormibacteraceae bacterium]
MSNQMIFLNLPARNLQESKDFWTKLGYSFNAQFSDERAACLVFSDTIYAMLLTTEFFRTFTTKAVVDGRQATEAIVALSADSRTAVDALVDRALAAGATETRPALDQGFTYQRSFDDLDGHQWEIIWTDPAQVQS